jgi:hypothetical protein
MAHAPEKRSIVRAAYVHERLAIEDAAAKANVSERTASRWKAEAREERDDWDRARAVKHMAGEGFQAVMQAMLEDFVTQHQRTMQQLREDEGISPLVRVDVMSKLADAFTKTMAAAGKASPELSRLAIANEVLRLFGEFVRQKFPKHGHAFVEVLPPFAEALAQHFG